MDTTVFDALTRHATNATSRRASLLALGAAGLAAAFGAPLGAAASKKGKKKCNTQKKQCASQVQGFCSGSMSEQLCLDALLPCCATCNVGNGVLCVLNIL